MLALCMLSLLLCVAGGGGAGFWSALLDAHVPHKLLLALLYCILDSEKQVGVACCEGVWPAVGTYVGAFCFALTEKNNW